LDGQPAIEVWKKYTRTPAKELGIDVDQMWDDPNQLGVFTCVFEGGVDMGKEYKVRWTGLSAETRDHLPFVCTMLEGTVIRIMQSSKDKLLASVKIAAENAKAKMEGRKYSGAIVFNCAVRMAMLGDDFSKEVEIIKQTLACPVVGGTVYGEIAREENQLSGFHNTTTVIVLIP